MFETHCPRPGESYTVQRTTHLPNRHDYHVSGDVHGFTLSGVLTIYLDDGEFSGYDWEGTPLDGDQISAVLDLFEADYQ